MDGLNSAGQGLFEFQESSGMDLLGLTDQIDGLVIAKANAISGENTSPWLDLELDSKLAEWARKGKGFLVLHAGTVGYPKGTALRKLTGGAFRHHPEAASVEIEVSNGHPVTSGVSSFSVHDEHYLMDLESEPEIFLRSVCNNVRQPAGWTSQSDDGRACVLTPGHYSNVWDHPEFQRLLKNALVWTTHE